MKNKIAYQGIPGAYSWLACQKVFPGFEPLSCPTFADAFAAVKKGKAKLGMIPIDNSTAGRVADIHMLLPKSGLFIVGEFFLPVHHCFLGVKGAKLSDIKQVFSHTHALPQCQSFIRARALKSFAYGDTAQAAEYVAKQNDRSKAAIASAEAAKIHGLNILARNIEDDYDNTTRFVILSKTPDAVKRVKGRKYLTSFLFTVRNIPAALYKALGGFASNGVNITKIESYLTGGKFSAAQFYCEAEGHPSDRNFHLAMEELEFFARSVRVLGTYPAHGFRRVAR